MSNRRGKLVRSMVVRVEYDLYNRVCIRRTGNRPSHAVAQGASSFYRGPGPLAAPLAPALCLSILLTVLYRRCATRYRHVLGVVTVVNTPRKIRTVKY